MDVGEALQERIRMIDSLIGGPTQQVAIYGSLDFPVAIDQANKICYSSLPVAASNFKTWTIIAVTWESCTSCCSFLCPSRSATGKPRFGRHFHDGTLIGLCTHVAP
jgi:hypothetical protein